EQVICITQIVCQLLQAGRVGFAGNDAIDEGRTKMAVFFHPQQEIGFEPVHFYQFFDDAGELLAVVDDELGGDDDHARLGATVEGLEAFVEEGQQLTREGCRRYAADIVVDELDAYFGGIGDDDLHLGVAGEGKDVLPLVAGR